MHDFARLILALDASRATREKLAVLAQHFTQTASADAAWSAFFLCGGRLRTIAPSRVLRQAALKATGLPQWLFEESYQAVGDLAETIAHLLPDSPTTGVGSVGLSAWMRNRLLPMRGLAPEQLVDGLLDLWGQLDAGGRFVLNKLLTGGFRVGVSRQLLTRALADAFGLDRKTMAQRLIGYADVHPKDTPQRIDERLRERFDALVAHVQAGEPADPERQGHPYPFFLAHPLAQSANELGEIQDWMAEWKWDGVRAQLVCRVQRQWLWSRGEELISEAFPEIVDAARALPSGTVLDGEVLAWETVSERPLPFAALQRRLGRERPSATLMKRIPVRFVAYDLLELGGCDWRERPQWRRRQALESVLGTLVLTGGPIGLSPLVASCDWAGLSALRDSSRARTVEGLMLKHRQARYGIGRTRDGESVWWKWKLAPLTVDAVLVYAQRGHGRRASLYTDYTFALWDRAVETSGPPERELLTFAKAYSGLTDVEIARVDAIIRRTVIEKFGPVRRVIPTLVFEIAFEGLSRSTRHKSGIAVRFPRILRWRTDKTPEQADSIQTLHALLLQADTTDDAAVNESAADGGGR